MHGLSAAEVKGAVQVTRFILVRHIQMPAPDPRRLKIISTKWSGGAKFPADVKITCTKPASPNRRRVTLFLSFIPKGNEAFIAKQKSAPLAYLHCVPGRFAPLQIRT